jgi:acyl carrier protein
MEIRQPVREFVIANFYVPNPEALDDDASLLDQGIIDSTAVLEVIAYLEDSFGIEVQDSEMLPENLDSIGSIVNFVTRKLASA